MAGRPTGNTLPCAPVAGLLQPQRVALIALNGSAGHDNANLTNHDNTSPTIITMNHVPHGWPGEEAGDLPPPIFRVTIPAERDQPGRYHYERLRGGGTYCD